MKCATHTMLYVNFLWKKREGAMFYLWIVEYEEDNKVKQLNKQEHGFRVLIRELHGIPKSS